MLVLFNQMREVIQATNKNCEFNGVLGVCSAVLYNNAVTKHFLNLPVFISLD